MAVSTVMKIRPMNGMIIRIKTFSQHLKSLIQCPVPRPGPYSFSFSINAIPSVILACVNAKQKCHLRCETEMSCFVSENAFDRLAIYFRAFSFPNRNHEDDNFLVYNLVYKAIA